MLGDVAEGYLVKHRVKKMQKMQKKQKQIVCRFLFWNLRKNLFDNLFIYQARI